MRGREGEAVSEGERGRGLSEGEREGGAVSEGERGRGCE